MLHKALGISRAGGIRCHVPPSSFRDARCLPGYRYPYDLSRLLVGISTNPTTIFALRTHDPVAWTEIDERNSGGAHLYM